MKDKTVDAKRQTILQAAWQAFASYGYRKTSMDDIARGAGVSRPALYLYYRNKEDIFRSLAQRYYDEAVEMVSAALGAAGDVPDQLERAFTAQGGTIMRAMLSSPHGMELLDTSNATAADIIATGEARLTAAYAHWLNSQVQAGRVALQDTPQEVAATLTAALKGIKTAAPQYDVYMRRVTRLAALLGGGLAAD
ncbi:TetR/AcrR family transcriptional regulator [Rhodobacteraceae bacterium F11138]|nr:TetR/AcrR family transcriptional regulator [Rhodobacteraceae bacterium F11138]